MGHESDVLAGHVALLNEAVFNNVCGEARSQCALWIVSPVGVIPNVDFYMSDAILGEINCGDCAILPAKYILDKEDLVDEEFLVQVNGHDEGVSKCYLCGRNSIALLDRRVCGATGVDDRIDIKSCGSYFEITGQVFFLVAKLGGVVSNDRCSKLRLEQVWVLESNYGRKREPIK